MVTWRSQVRRGEIVEGFIGEQKDFALNPILQGEPLEPNVCRGDIVCGYGAGANTCDRVLEPVKMCIRDAREDSI